MKNTTAQSELFSQLIIGNPVTFLRKRISFISMLFVLFFGGMTVATGQAIVLFNTGVDDNGAVLPYGTNDPHWTILSGPSITTPVPGVASYGDTGYAGNANSIWISVDANNGEALGSPYTFQETFDLTGYNPSTAQISGAWGVDNYGQIFLNGVAPIGTGTLSMEVIQNPSPTSNFNTFHNFSITGGFVAGINTLDFVTTNVDQGSSGALNVNSLSGSVSVPEPADTAWIMAFGAALLVVLVRRKGRTGAKRGQAEVALI